jgi:hypothetical protein
MAKTIKPTGTLKKLVDAGKNPSRVLTSVERFVLSRPADTSRATDVIHPSAMVKPDWCHRAEYYTLQGHEPAPSKYKASMKQLLTFEEGHRIHARWQNWFYDMGKLYGKWRCPDCRFVFKALSPTSCKRCSYVGSLEYREVSVFSPEHGIAGHADGWLKGFGDDLLLEIKSVGEGTIRWEDPQFFREHDNDFKKAWAALQQPFAVHIAQAQVYVKLLEIEHADTKTNTPQEIVFIYESKPTQEIKEFVIPKSDFGISNLFEDAKNIMLAIENQEPPLCNINTGGTCYKCEVYNDN